MLTLKATDLIDDGFWKEIYYDMIYKGLDTRLSAVD